ncbi:terminase small subunit [Roseateles depolymerans]|uniref:Terminase small subunit n=1 Tax=Roseateles depolymerans TaxID=76731 RepID=A0A0U3LJX0_9BURK|nr:terminase small subunit [Roseateles depolymerans]ALV06690.1 Terminase small subunit [Roseateles depolymerans]REG19667.1 phage terminase small subunit [Roseateles depolymerans]
MPIKKDLSVLTHLQRLFVDEYLIDLNASKAALRAGYSAKTAGRIGSYLLEKPKVAAAIEEAMKERANRTNITADRILQELARVAFFDIRKLYNEDGSMKKPTELDDETAAALAAVETIEGLEKEAGATTTWTRKIKAVDKVSALTLAMRHLGMLRDKVEHSGPGGQPLPAMAPVFNVTLSTDDE